jgi:DnaA family protein
VGFQLTLGLKLGPKTTLESFIAGINEPILKGLKSSLQSRAPIFMHLWGVEGCGKTHILQAACQSLVYQGFQAGYIDLHHLGFGKLDILKGLHQLKLVCFDHLDALDENEHISMLSEFMQQSLEQGHQILTCSRHELTNPLLINLPFFVQCQMQALSNEDMQFALRHKAEERGLLVPLDVEEVILNKVGSSMKALVNIFDKLEQTCDREKKKVTLKFFKSMIKESVPTKQD